MPYRILLKKGKRSVPTFLKSHDQKQIERLVREINRLVPIKGNKIEVSMKEYQLPTSKKKPEPEPEPELEPEPESESSPIPIDDDEPEPPESEAMVKDKEEEE